MNRIVILSLIVVVIVAISGCNDARKVGDTKDSTGSDGQTKAANVPEVNEAPPRRYAQPMPVDILARTAECDWIEISYVDKDQGNPGQAMSCNFILEPGNENPMRCIGYDSATRQEYSGDVVDEQSFKGLIEYMVDNPDVFFNHSEFEGVAPGDYPVPDGFSEWVFLHAPTSLVDSSTGWKVEYVILKGIAPGETVAPEMQYVMDTLNGWRQSLLSNPVQQNPVAD